MDKIKTTISGKKTYIISGVAILFVWVDYFFGIGLSEGCKDLAKGETCSITLSGAMQATWAAITAVTLRAGIGKAEK
jgi:hypothetical protein